MTTSLILETQDLTCRFGGVVAVDRVNLALREGELRCLIGPNGAGKSTLFKCLTHQLLPSSGRVLLKGIDVSRFDSFQIARMGVAIKNQIPSVYGGLSVAENIWIAAQRSHSGKPLKNWVAQVLEQIRFADSPNAHKRVDELSHAHRQWVELGMLLATRPRLALLDEPAAGMTRDEMIRTVALIKTLNQNATIIVVEHDLEFISLLAKRVTVLHRGAVLVEDTMQGIARNEMVREIYLGKKWKAQ